MLNIAKVNEYFDSFTVDQIENINNSELKKNANDFKKFKEALSKGKCSLCGYELIHFSEKKPCLHWLLKPKGFKNRHFPILYSRNGYHMINSYLRWVANSASPLKNVNDLVLEKNPKKIIEETIRFRNLEWSFEATIGCMEGTSHTDKQGNKIPHFHFQMKIDGLVILNYSQFHVPFDSYDEFCFAVENNQIDRVKAKRIETAGMQAFFDNFTPEELLDKMSRSDDYDSAPFEINTFVQADEGTTISGDELAEIFEEHKKTGVPIAKLIRKIKNASVQSYITPGKGVPEIAARLQHRGARKKDN